MNSRGSRFSRKTFVLSMAVAFVLSCGVTSVRAAQSCTVSRIDGGALPARPQFSGISSDGSSDVWAVGEHATNSLVALYPLADHWDGARWTVVYPPNVPGGPSGLNGVAARAPGDVWAVGFGYPGTLIEHWNGAAWSVVPSPKLESPGPRTALEGVASFAADRAFAVGLYEDQTSNFRPLLERWDGSMWSIVDAPGPRYGFYFSISGSSGRDVWAVGGILPPGKSSELPVTLHFDGSHWRSIRAPMPQGTVDALFDGVVALSPRDAWAVGSSSKGAGLYQTLTEHWNGTAWTIVPSPNARGRQTQGFIGVSAGAPNDVWAVGEGGVGRPIAAHWNGTTWRLVDAGQGFGAGSVLESVTAVGSQMVTAGYDVERWKPAVLARGSCS